MTARPLALVFAALLAVGLTLALPAGAQDDRQAPDEIPRTVDVRTDEAGAQIRLEPEDRQAADPVVIGFSTLNATLDIVHRPGAEDDGRRLEVDLEEVFEYEDEDGNGSYDPGEAVVSAWRVSRVGGEEQGNRTVDWGSPTVTNVTREGLQGQRVVLPAQIGDGGSFEVRMLAFGNATEVGNTTLKSTGVAVDLVIRYPFEQSGTDLGLIMTARTGEDAEIGSAHRAFAPDQDGAVVTRRGAEQAANLFYAWRNTSTVDGRAAPVVTDVLERQGAEEPEGTSPDREDRRRQQYNGEGANIDEGNVTVAQLVLSYERGQRVAHDGKAEVAISSIEGETATPGLTVAVAATTLAGAALARRRG